MAALDLAGLTKHYGPTTAVKAIDLTIGDGEFLVLLGPSGCGKTTTLRMIAGFIEPSAGRITLGGRDITDLPPWQRNLGMVFQNYALFPHLTVAANVAFGLEMRKFPKADIARRVAEALDLVRLGKFGERLPRQLSGGQQQRVALARALAIHPDALLLDEPLSNLDAKLRQEVQVEIKTLQRKLGLTTVMVTHDQQEALTVADRLVLMRDGEIRQTGAQADLYERPADRFVADFVGRSVFVTGTADGLGGFTSEGGLRLQITAGVSGRGALCLRPERLTLLSAPDSQLENCLPGRVELVTYLGAQIDVHIRLSDQDKVIVQIPNRADGGEPREGQACHVGWRASVGQVFIDDV